jgi:hypothetical protein
MRKPLFAVTALLVVITLACGFNVSTANIASAVTSQDPDGSQPTTTFDQADAFYLAVQLANAPDDTKVKAVWTVVEADGVEPNFALGEKELIGGGTVNFSLENDNLWPVGKYKVDLYLNDTLDRTLEFEVTGEVSAAPAVEPTPTPEPEPTATNTPAPSPTKPAEGSGSDSISLKPTTTPEEEPAAAALPMQEEPYTHPSDAFSIAIPQGWEVQTEDESSVSVGDDRSRVGVVFVNVGAEFTEDQMVEFIENSRELIIDTFSDSHEVVSESNQLADDGFYYMAVSFDDGDGDADIFYEQLDTVIYILYMASLDYQALDATWTDIINSYQLDSQAAVAAMPVDDTPAPAAAPTKAPPPPPAGPSAPAGKGLLVFNNNTGVDFVVDVIGPTNTSQVIPPGVAHEFVLDPGHYTLNGHSPGGQWSINAYQFDLAAGQVFPLDLN